MLEQAAVFNLSGTMMAGDTQSPYSPDLKPPLSASHFLNTFFPQGRIHDTVHFAQEFTFLRTSLF